MSTNRRAIARPTAAKRETLASTVRSARERADLTQAELARRVGVSRTAIAELEAGRIQQPRALVFARLSAALGIPAALLLAGAGVVTGDASTAGVESDELVAMATTMVGMAGRDRRWLQERFVELRDLLVMRRSSRPAARRARRR